MAALPGTLDEWVQGRDGRWSRKDHPEDGVITLTPPLTFVEYYAKRAEPEPPPEPDPRDVKIAALEATCVLLRTRLDKLDGGSSVLTVSR